MDSGLPEIIPTLLYIFPQNVGLVYHVETSVHLARKTPVFTWKGVHFLLRLSSFSGTLHPESVSGGGRKPPTVRAGLAASMLACNLPQVKVRGTFRPTVVPLHAGKWKGGHLHSKCLNVSI